MASFAWRLPVRSPGPNPDAVPPPEVAPSVKVAHGGWVKESPISRKVYVRPARDAQRDPFGKVPVAMAGGQDETAGTRGTEVDTP